MEIANLGTPVIRQANGHDKAQISRLLRHGGYVHSHADWRLPSDWLGTPGFVVCEERPGGKLIACLAAAADPPPAAWVRLAAMRSRQARLGPEKGEILGEMIDRVWRYLQSLGVTELGWLALDPWPDAFLADHGFRRLNWITTFVKNDLGVPKLKEAEVSIRPAKPEDMLALADIETAAFEPLWRHSASGLQLALERSLCFDVAERTAEANESKRIVGFQYSVRGENDPRSAHLVRITVHPMMQRRGVASTLLKAAFKRYQARGIWRVSLNTQVDNLPSHQLYRKFGFYRFGDQLPVWVRSS